MTCKYVVLFKLC